MPFCNYHDTITTKTWCPELTSERGYIYHNNVTRYCYPNPHSFCKVILNNNESIIIDFKYFTLNDFIDELFPCCIAAGVSPEKLYIL